MPPQPEADFAHGSTPPHGHPAEAQGSFSSINQSSGTPRAWEKSLEEPFDAARSLASHHDLFPQLDPTALSFTQMLNQEMPTSEQLDAAVLDVMGSWSP